MIEVVAYSILSVLIVSVASLIGVLAISLSAKNLRKILIYLVSFSAGALFGDAFIHLLPEAIGEFGFTLNISLYLLFGILFSFIVEKIIHWRHCHHPTTKDHPHPFAIMNLVGDGVHNFIDGLIITASYMASVPVGVTTTVAVLLHEIPQEIGDFGVLVHGGFSRGKAIFYNFMTALVAIVGAIIALVLGTYFEHALSFLLPFAAGCFIYIAGSDLIPELHKERKVERSIMQFLVFVSGIAIMMLLLLLK